MFDTKKDPAIIIEDKGLKQVTDTGLIEIIVDDELVEPAIECIEQSAKTGRIGDGKIFISSIDEAIRIRTSETGDEAI